VAQPRRWAATRPGSGPSLRESRARASRKCSAGRFARSKCSLAQPASPAKLVAARNPHWGR
jgi:hypothetical protein